MTRHERQQAAAILRRVLEAVEQGRLSAAGPVGGRLARRLEGAVTALEIEAPDRRPPPGRVSVEPAP
jgi:hypothetical protein